ncbi:MAG: 3-oxoacyl-ACP reductase FabG [Alphaproteobacteria bacterium]|nr:MAG: 3-oxoacyl-ACP reductase FabG [Alphaproteobacteria bacterium]
MTVLQGKLAVITGGSRGIGAATAVRLAEMGADVAITFSKSDAEAKAIVQKITAMGRKAQAYKVDHTTPKAVGETVDKIGQDFGKIDILVNNAGIYEQKSLPDLTDAEFEKMFNINVYSVFAATRAAIKFMPDHGRIINIGSVLGERAIFPGMTAYAMSKFAVAGMSRAWAWDLGARKITVNCVEPGPINTDMNPENAEYSDEQRKMNPLSRFGQPKEVAAVIAFLASPESANVNGATIGVDGGMNA